MSYRKWVEKAAWEIMGEPAMLNEGEGTPEEMQEAYDENEALLTRRNEICDIITKHYEQESKGQSI